MIYNRDANADKGDTDADKGDADADDCLITCDYLVITLLYLVTFNSKSVFLSQICRLFKFRSVILLQIW